MQPGFPLNRMFFPEMGMLVRVMTMTTEQMMLSVLLKSTHAIQTDIFRGLQNTFSTHLKDVLTAQQLELDAIERETHAIACRRGWELQQEFPFRPRLPFPDSDCRIAERLILLYTKRLIHILKIRHGCNLRDHQIDFLLQKLQDCQLAGIRDLLSFL